MSILNQILNISPTNDQKQALLLFEQFLSSKENVFILSGYAGTGKTTLLRTMVNYVNQLGKTNYFMAPTGRAAKVLSENTGRIATTIHKGIYSFNDLQEVGQESEDSNDVSFKYYFKLRNNPEVNGSVIFVDEASMISNALSEGEFFRFGSGFLLKDLVKYSGVSNPNSLTKLVFIGDPAQLPPVGMNESPALDPEYLRNIFQLQCIHAELKEVKRQNQGSSVLKLATEVRQSIEAKNFSQFSIPDSSRDVRHVKVGGFLDSYFNTSESKIAIAFKNKTALGINQDIRSRLYHDTSRIQKGDRIIIGRNNYSLGILNGEFGVVNSVSDQTIQREVSFKIQGGELSRVKLIWRAIELVMVDIKGEEIVIPGKMLENYLTGDNYLTSDEQRALYIDFKTRHPNLKKGTQEFRDAIKGDPYFNCIQLKYGYAVTCHKAQGGQWKNVFTFWDKGTLKDIDPELAAYSARGKSNEGFFRWAYTAITRASESLFCINPPSFSYFSKIGFLDVEIQDALHTFHEDSKVLVEIDFDEDAENQLRKYNLNDRHVNVQDHFIKLLHLASKAGIEIRNWEKKGYEIRYYFSRENETCGIKFWVNDEVEFNKQHQQIPSASNSASLFNDISSIIPVIKNIVVNRRTAEGILSKVTFDRALEESHPHLSFLYEVMKGLLDEKSITIEAIDHLQYCERYTLTRRAERLVVDFTYDGKGFFKTVKPLVGNSNSRKLSDDLKECIESIKPTHHAV